MTQGNREINFQLWLSLGENNHQANKEDRGH